MVLGRELATLPCPCPGAVILAGGQGRRLAADKGCLPLGGRPIVARVVAAARQVCGRIIIVGDAPLPEGLGVEILPDAFSYGGPLQALGVGLRALGAPWVALLAWDMPFVSPQLLRYLASLTRACDAVVPRVGERAHPLCALYSVACEPVIASLDAGRNRAMSALLDRVRVRWVEQDELRRFGDPERLFFNVNTPADLERARVIAEGESEKGWGAS